MVKVNLAKALKNKNRLVGEIKKVQAIIVRENSREITSNSKVDVKEQANKMNELIDTLIDLKSKITVANIGIYPKIAEMSECKSLMEYYATLDTKDGKYALRGYGETQEIIYEAAFKQTDVDTIRDAMQKRINNLQDEIDDYNATTFIEMKE
jgi:pyridoxine 5'-phosphate synthase PdxJ